MSFLPVIVVTTIIVTLVLDGAMVMIIVKIVAPWQRRPSWSTTVSSDPTASSTSLSVSALALALALAFA